MKTPAASLVSSTTLPSERLTPDTSLEEGQWYWVRGKSKAGKWLGCVTHIGTNYAELTSVDEGSSRVPLANFDDICTFETRASAVIAGQIQHHQDNVRALTEEIKALCAGLGIVPQNGTALKGTEELALTASTGIGSDWKGYEQSLVQLQQKTLPDLFKSIEEEHKSLASWMKATLIPARANLRRVKDVTGLIENRISTVELYAGLIEQLVMLRDGKPAESTAQVHLFQRRHYMDEECLANYEAGGITFDGVGAFDAWLLRPENLTRILPMERCIVAFRVRRNDKERDFESLRDFIDFVLSGEKDLDMLTFLYVRNGEQVHRLSTNIDFGPQLFPDTDTSVLLGNAGGDLWFKTSGSWNAFSELLSQREHDALRIKVEEREAEHELKKLALKEWEKLPKDEQEGKKKPYVSSFAAHDRRDFEDFKRLTTDHIFYDDVMAHIREEMNKHNRTAVVLQGLLDRSSALHPHPAWKLWTPEGFTNAIKLVYDDSKALVSGEDLPEFAAYQAQLNKSLKVGDVVYGQEIAWLRAQAEKENDRRDRDWRNSQRYSRELTTFRPYGNPGPGRFARVTRVTRNKEYEVTWYRTYRKNTSVNEADTPILTKETFPSSALLNVSAYTPGDYRMFYADPRLRERYLEWAPFLLSAEDWAAGKIGAADRPWQDRMAEFTE